MNPLDLQTPLTTLKDHGEDDGRYTQLVNGLFTCPFGDFFIRDLGVYNSLNEFLKAFSKNDPCIEFQLKSWVQHYGLEKYINRGKLHSIRNSKLVSFKFSNAFFVQLNQVSTRNWKH
jgi:hypothetical protein